MSSADTTLAHPEIVPDPTQPGRQLLRGDWVIDNALSLAEVLRNLPSDTTALDARGIGRIDSLGVLQLLRHCTRCRLGESALFFREEHQALVQAIEDVHDDRPKPRREFGFAAAMERLGQAMHHNGREIVALVAFLGEVLVKTARLVREPRRLRPIATVHHMEQVGLDAVPLVALLSFMIGAVVAFLGANILADFGASIYVVELVSISFLREFAVLLTAIILAGRTASAFTAQIGAMVNREEVDAIRTLGLDPVGLLVIPRVAALVAMLPLLTFIAMLAGLLGGIAVGASSLDISPQAYIGRMHDTIELRHFLVGMIKAPVFAVVIGLIGCLEGLQVTGTAQSVGERTTSSVVQTISLVIVIDAIAAIWFMNVGW